MEAKGQLGRSREGIRRVLPRGINAASREVVNESQRERLIESMIELAATKGYAATTIADIVGGAGVAKPTFYNHFKDKENCFLAAYDKSANGAIDAMVAALDPDAEVGARIVAGLDGFLRYVAEDESRARVLLLESLRVGPAAAAHVSEWHGFFANAYVQAREEIRQTQSSLPPISPTRALAIVGAVNEPVAATLRSGEAAQVLELKDELALVITALALATP